MYSGITSDRVLNGELLYTKILEVNLFAFAYRLFRREFLPTRRDILHGYSFLFAALYVFCVNLGGFYEWVVLIFLVLIFSLDFLITGKSVHPDSKLGRSRLSLLTSKVFMAFDLYSSKVIMSSGITHHRQRKGLSARREKLWSL